MTEGLEGQGLEGKRVVVSAGAGGIGKAIAEAFMAAGAGVHICDVDEDAIAAFRAEAPDLGATLCDVAEQTQVDRLFDEAEANLGGLDVLVNNVGIGGPTGFIEDMAADEWRRTIDVNIIGHYHCLRRAVPLLKAAGGGSIVGLSSTAGIMGYPYRTPYAASKWAVVGITKSLAMELGEFAIRVNCICPGPVSGPRIEAVIEAEAEVRGETIAEARKRHLSTISLATFIEPGDIAAMTLFLCSDAGAKISGQALAVDGHTETLA